MLQRLRVKNVNVTIIYKSTLSRPLVKNMIMSVSRTPIITRDAHLTINFDIRPRDISFGYVLIADIARFDIIGGGWKQSDRPSWDFVHRDNDFLLSDGDIESFVNLILNQNNQHTTVRIDEENLVMYISYEHFSVPDEVIEYKGVFTLNLRRKAL
jgi:hypothetical protein